MIHHYINLVCWREMLATYDPERDVVWVDSVSLKLLVAFFRRNAAYKPGTSVVSSIEFVENSTKEWFFFTASHIESLPKDKQLPLPIFTEIKIPQNVMSILKALPSDTKVGLGISAPKQNYLAIAMHSIRSDLEYHCLGAALNIERKQFAASKNGHTVSGTGLEWIGFLIKYPTRTSAKIMKTLSEIFKIAFHKTSRALFLQFSEICKDK